VHVLGVARLLWSIREWTLLTSPFLVVDVMPWCPPATHPCFSVLHSRCWAHTTLGTPSTTMAALNKDMLTTRSGQFDLESIQRVNLSKMALGKVELLQQCTSLVSLNLAGNMVCLRSRVCVCVSSWSRTAVTNERA